jgi:pimeloyl-ACP methyl ester carboxylesterase
MHENIAGSELHIIPGAGHGPQMERPAEFNAVLTAFLDRVHSPLAATESRA